jgi:molecular chaperone DnaK (HSP70)
MLPAYPEVFCMSRYAVGIDLGTTNTVLAYAELHHPDPAGNIQILPITQGIDVGETGTQAQLPSFAYLPGVEVAADAQKLPWESPLFLGEIARRQGARVPGRLIHSAKSWLCHEGVDRSAPILPWGGAAELSKYSPIEISARYLSHLAAAFQHSTGAALAEQEIVLCVPASFDEVARELTVEAAQQAGLTRFHLLEEPQAAFYSFVARHRKTLTEELTDIRSILVVDVGGGTTDLSLIEAKVDGESVSLTRVAVGDHLMLGGDNMDQAIAHALEARLGTARGASEWSELCLASRNAKEKLLAEDAPEAITISLLGRGSSLLGNLRKTQLSRNEVTQLVMDGFFPTCAFDEQPTRRRTGLRELGLPYAHDPAISRHIAAFLQRHGGHAPDAFLCNGGVLGPSIVRERLSALFAVWSGKTPKQLPHTSLSLAVAEGAAYYALARSGAGILIGGGTARAYYVGVESSAGKAALCVIPRRHDSIEEVEILGKNFALRVGEPVRFQLYASSSDTKHQIGEVVPLSEDLIELTPIETVLRDSQQKGEISVRLHAQTNELGVLCLSLVRPDNQQRFRLAFNLRANEGSATSEEGVAISPSKRREASELLETIYGKKPRDIDTRDITGLGRSLEKIVGHSRDEWATPLLREMSDLLLVGVNQRNRSADHHATWLNVTGFCLRPGFGYPLDDDRLAKVTSIFAQGPQFRQEKRSWNEWWIFWRRIAGGLSQEVQERFFDQSLAQLRKKGQNAPEGQDEMMRFLASLEKVPPRKKAQLGETWLQDMTRHGLSANLLWALGRIGNRNLFNAGAEWVIPTQTVEDWLERLLALNWKQAEEAAFTAALLGRKTGDRERDISPELAQQLLQKLRAGKYPALWAELVANVTELSAQERKRVFGESLPSGLRLVSG